MADEMNDWATAAKGHLKHQLPYLAGELNRCGSHLVFRHYVQDDKLALHEAYFCNRDKLCPFCAVRRSGRLLRRLVEGSIKLMNDRPALRPFLVTLTVKNGPDLRERFEHLRRGFLKLNERRKWAARSPYLVSTVAAAAAGGFSAFEIKRGDGTRGGGWHPHVHAVWFCETPPAVEKLSAEWLELTGDSHVVDVRPFHFVRDGLVPTVELLARDLSEVCKYSLKFSTMTHADAFHAFTVLFRRRLVSTFGELHGVKLDDELTDDAADGPFIEIVARMNDDDNCFTAETTGEIQPPSPPRSREKKRRASNLEMTPQTLDFKPPQLNQSTHADQEKESQSLRRGFGAPAEVTVQARAENVLRIDQLQPSLFVDETPHRPTPAHRSALLESHHHAGRSLAFKKLDHALVALDPPALRAPSDVDQPIACVPDGAADDRVPFVSSHLDATHVTDIGATEVIR